MRQARYIIEKSDNSPLKQPWGSKNSTGKTRGYFIFGLFFLVCVLIGFWRVGEQLRHFVFEEDHIPVQGLVLQGDMEYVSQDEIRNSLLQDSQVNNFFTLDVNEIQKRLLDIPWAYQVSIRKRWPALLYIYIIEQNPCALWGDKKLLSIRGHIFEAPRDKIKKPLVQLYGPDEMASAVWDQYLQFERILALNQYHISAVKMTNRHSWEISLINGPRLILGRENMLNKLQTFIDVFPKLENKEKIEYLDLRYDTGVAVQWKQEGSGDDQSSRQKSDRRS